MAEWRGGRTGHANLLLALMMLEVWLGEYLPARHGARAGAGGRVSPLRYAVVTPARNEECNLQRLGAALAAQTLPPERVDRGRRRLHRRHAASCSPSSPPRHAWVRPLAARAARKRAAWPPGAATRAT